MDLVWHSLREKFQFGELVAQAKNLDITFIRTQSVDPSTLIYCLLSIVVLIVAVIGIVYRYQRWKKYNEFVMEMRNLELEPDAEGTLAFMVKRYSMDEPISILMSEKKFDDMAQKEMVRVLASEGSIQSKRDFIDTVYKIRNKTYRPDYLHYQEQVWIENYYQ